MTDNQKAKNYQRRGRPYIKNPITQLSIIEQSGMVLFHKSYVNTNVDEVLFSGFSAAIVVFPENWEQNYIISKWNSLNFILMIQKRILL
ncbi:MAG: hypothetical protein K9W46_01250 [Candidatus Heimdallarchaeum endolithica]|uniref:Uncharacterized protein n=1 Tax=Candidatus Heimdallarchaeum endolithica TaxID=2876572 RepID=A0A9Y1FP52_9ARCH|nr:MAG: hypothetical protein K9W46_01250 [Candidatus Heimdallarchaeum endolithica]